MLDVVIVVETRPTSPTRHLHLQLHIINRLTTLCMLSIDMMT